MPLNTSKLFGDGDLKTPFYVVRRKGSRSALGMAALHKGKVTRAVCIFQTRAQAENFKNAFCRDPKINQDPKQWEVVSSDAFGGTLRLLDLATNFYTHVILDHHWKGFAGGFGAVEIDLFAYGVSAMEANVPLEEAICIFPKAQKSSKQ